MPIYRLTKGKELNRQTLFGKEKKEGKLYPNADFTNLCYMSADEVEKDKRLYESRSINNYFTTDFKKQFKVYRHGDKLCYFRDDDYVPLLTGKYGFIVSPKGGFYAVAHLNGLPNTAEIQNGEFYHSFFRAGQPVQDGGFFLYDASKGQVSAIFRDSGHYKPTFSQHLRACLGLVDAGLLTTETNIGKFSDVSDPVTFKLSDIINNRVDYSAIATDPVGPTVVAPPPIVQISPLTARPHAMPLPQEHQNHSDLTPSVSKHKFGQDNDDQSMAVMPIQHSDFVVILMDDTSFQLTEPRGFVRRSFGRFGSLLSIFQRYVLGAAPSDQLTTETEQSAVSRQLDIKESLGAIKEQEQSRREENDFVCIDIR